MRLSLLAAFAFMLTGCTKEKVVETTTTTSSPAAAPAPHPHPHPHPPVAPHPKPCPPDCPKPCPPKKDTVGTKTAVGTVKQLEVLRGGGLELVLEGEKLPHMAPRNADFTINGTAVTAQDVALWFKQAKDPVRVKLKVAPSGLVVAAEFWAEKH